MKKLLVSSLLLFLLSGYSITASANHKINTPNQARTALFNKLYHSKNKKKLKQAKHTFYIGVKKYKNHYLCQIENINLKKKGYTGLIGYYNVYKNGHISDAD